MELGEGFITFFIFCGSRTNPLAVILRNEQLDRKSISAKPLLEAYEAENR